MYRMWLVVALAMTVACEDDRPPPAPPVTTDLGLPVIPVVGPPADGDDGTPPTTTGPTPPATGGDGDDTGTTTLPIGLGEPCRTTCECPPATACIQGECLPTADIVYCCSDVLCPTGLVCETEDARLGVCP